MFPINTFFVDHFLNVNVNLFLMLCFFVVAILFFTYVTSEDKLIHVHALWRHGERNPRKLFHGDLNGASAFPEGLGQLTKNGINQFFTLGQKFQSRYINDYQLLSPDYTPSEVYARSTDIDRTIISAMTFYSGLYSDLSTTDDHILAPVPIRTIPSEDDFLFLLRFKCQRLNELKDITDKSKHIQALLKKHYSLLSEVSIKTQIPISYYQSIYVFDTATIEKSHGLPIPSWITQEKSEEFDQLFVDYVSTQYGFVELQNESLPFNFQLELAKISCGALIAEIMDRLILKIQCLKNETSECGNVRDQKLYTYSGHDITVVELFGGLGFTTFAFEKQTLPSFGATIILELWEDEAITNTVELENNQLDYYYFKIYYYQNYNVKDPKYIGNLIPECQGRKGCPISYLFKRAELLRPKPNLKSYCTQTLTSKATKVADSIKNLFIFSIIMYYYL